MSADIPNNSSFIISQFKNAMSNLANGVSLVNILVDNDIHGVTINSFNSISLNPSLVLFNLNKNNSSIDLYLNCKNFTINILSEGQKDISDYFASSSNRNDNHKKWFEIDNGVCVLSGSLSCIFCSLDKIIDVGDHYLIIGRVNEIKNINQNSRPLIYFRRNYCILDEKN